MYLHVPHFNLESHANYVTSFFEPSKMSEVQRKTFRICPKIPCGKKEVLHPKTISPWPYKLMISVILLTEYFHLVFLPYEARINEIKTKVNEQYQKLEELIRG